MSLDAGQVTPEADRKRLATLRAVAARHGIPVEVIEADDGRPEFIVSRWAMTRRCRSLDELELLLARMGVNG